MEARQARRYATDIAGELIWDDGRRRQPCLIKDLSENGARVTKPFLLQAPPAVWLFEPGSGQLFECEVKWQADTEMGLFFVDIASRVARRALIRSHGTEPQKHWA